ncbi:MAG: apolipoprotein N-acyltransferase [Caulobacterales bacterium]
MTVIAPSNTLISSPLGWFSGLSGWRTIALCAAAGAVATLGHAPFHFAPAFLVGITLLVWMIDAVPRKRRVSAAFARGWAFGFGHFLSGLYWVSSAFLVDPDSFGLGLGIAAAVALAAGLALFWGAGCALVARFWISDWRRLPLFALGLMLTEIARGHLCGGFPWQLPAYIWEAGGPISQTASVVGAYGLSGLTLLFAATPAAVLDGQASALRRFGPLLVGALCFGVLWGTGLQRLDSALVALPGATPVVRVADPGLSQAEKWQTPADVVLGEYLGISGDPRESRADYVVWPEGAIPAQSYTLVYGLDGDENQYALDPTRAAVIAERMGDRVLIAGSTRCAPMAECRAFFEGARGAEGLRFFNSAVAIDGVSGVARLAGVYDKHRLTPFGEFIPLWNLISGLNIAPLQRIGAGFTPGPIPQRLVIDAEAEPVIVQICYESIFPGLIPRGNERPGWIVNVTNDAWFGNGSGPLQHFNIARYRAIEEGLPMARAASGGVSAIVDAYGRPTRIAAVGVGYAEAQLPQTLPPTWFARFGWLLVGAMMLGLLGLRCIPLERVRRGDEQ